ncbi:MAG TPA: hypothetical protein PKA90_01850 [Ignavibacteria bacterium]|nr:hypothetical protein [Ignavibacteria bacterium]HMR39151.1 hypothetical protein [Ignavibacteria bacterium]
MKKLLIVAVIFFSSVFSGCSDDDTDNSVTPDPPTGEILLATVSGDSVGTNSSGSAIEIHSRSISSSTLNFTDRDSARVSFFYSGENNTSSSPVSIYYLNSSDTVFLYKGTALIPTATEQFLDASMVSPMVNQSFRYTIISSSSSGSSYFKFRDLKIYKK